MTESDDWRSDVTRQPVRTSKPPAWRSARRHSSAASTPESGSTSTSPDAAMPGKRRAPLCRRELLDGRTGGRQRAGDGAQRRLVAQRHLAGDVEQPPTRRGLEVAPAPDGPARAIST